MRLGFLLYKLFVTNWEKCRNVLLPERSNADFFFSHTIVQFMPGYLALLVHSNEYASYFHQRIQRPTKTFLPRPSKLYYLTVPRHKSFTTQQKFQKYQFHVPAAAMFTNKAALVGAVQDSHEKVFWGM